MKGFSVDDLAKFMETTKVPRGKQSRAKPFIDDILVLKKKGYALSQICKYLLEMKGLYITSASVSRAIAAHDGTTPKRKAQKDIAPCPSVAPGGESEDLGGSLMARSIKEMQQSKSAAKALSTSYLTPSQKP